MSTHDTYNLFLGMALLLLTQMTPSLMARLVRRLRNRGFEGKRAMRIYAVPLILEMLAGTAGMVASLGRHDFSGGFWFCFLLVALILSGQHLTHLAFWHGQRK